jgi:hypothetical protein
MPMTPLAGDIGVADLAVLERYADPNVLVKVGKTRLTKLIARASHGQLGADRATEWLVAARSAVGLYGGHPAVAFVDLAAEVASEVGLLRATQHELAGHAAERERCYRWVDPLALARSLPGLGEIGGPALVACMGNPRRFRKGKQFRSFTGLAPKASETGETDRKGQPMSKAGSSLLRTTLVRAADTARKQDPQLARIYFVQMVERGKDHIGALCVVAANLAERAWSTMDRGMPYGRQSRDAGRGEGHHRCALHRDRGDPAAPAVEEEGGEGPPESPRGTFEAQRSRRKRTGRPSPPSIFQGWIPGGQDAGLTSCRTAGPLHGRAVATRPETGPLGAAEGSYLTADPR